MTRNDDAEEKAVDAILRTCLALMLHSDLLIRLTLNNEDDVETKSENYAARFMETSKIALSLIRIPVIERLLRVNEEVEAKGWFETIVEQTSIDFAANAIERFSEIEKRRGKVYDIGRDAAFKLGYQLFDANPRDIAKAHALINSMSELAEKPECAVDGPAIMRKLMKKRLDSREIIDRIAKILNLSAHERIEAVVELRDAESAILQRGKT
jgi:hypothetical protein